MKGLSVAAAVFVTASLCSQGNAAQLDFSSTVQHCEACHDSNNPIIPRLEGQSAYYLATRVRSFADLTRQSPHAFFMSQVNSTLTDETVEKLAKYFAAKPAVEPSPSGTLVAEGKRLYSEGDGAHLKSCQECHGDHGEGKGSVPRIAGQRATYLHNQLQNFSMITRVHDTMNLQARYITDQQINALVAYLANDKD